MTTDTSERGLERLICTALTGSPCDPGAGPAESVREAAARLPDETEGSEPIDDANPLTYTEEDAADLDTVPEEADVAD